MSSEQSDTGTDRRYVCTSCDGVVRARWTEPGGFHVGCDCTTVPVVPQMGQAETPECWIVEREECCRGVEASSLETAYGERGQDYRCPECGATYSWDGTMATGPDADGPDAVDQGQGLLTDGGTSNVEVRQTEWNKLKLDLRDAQQHAWDGNCGAVFEHLRVVNKRIDEIEDREGEDD